ncbi:hypothetical protein AB1K62_13035 [Parasphingorhabdus sp. JC815]|uniref:hypothetical protein n=1 Tax=Parasphingorhabdus sp. JC815 TaxID=3232140 RepID=UPI00345A0F44
MNKKPAEEHRSREQGDIAFLWLGETLLIPHMWPIIEALAEARRDIQIDIWTSTSAHEALLKSWNVERYSNIRLRRSRLFRDVPSAGLGQNIESPAKLPMLLSLLPYIAGYKAVVVAEQTSLWLPKLLGRFTRLIPPFIFTIHGIGPIAHGRWKRLLSASKALVCNEILCQELRDLGMAEDRVEITGYAKSAFRQVTVNRNLFCENRPIILYSPHWQPARSSWPQWGREVLKQLVTDGRWNIIFAPHQRIVETDDQLVSFLRNFGKHDNLHVDLDSFAMVDGSYTRMADVYLGDSSSQVVEFLISSRPVVLLQPPAMTHLYAQKAGYNVLGETVTDASRILDAIAEAPEKFAAYKEAQKAFADSALGQTGPDAAYRAAEIVAGFADRSGV